MKKALMFFSILCLLNTMVEYSYSQTGWVRINPGFGHSYYGVHFIDANTGMACGTSGALIKTTNGGLNWISLNSGIPYKLSDVKMFTDQIAIAAGQNQIIIRTTNGGTNWSIVNPAASQNYDILNLSINNSEAMGFCHAWISPEYQNRIYRTSDMGLTWEISQPNVPAAWVHFINYNTGWAHGETHLGPPINQYYLDVNRTVNGGQSWSLVNRSSGGSINPGIIYFFDASLGFKISHIGTIYKYRTTNGGVSWDAGFEGLPSGYSSIINCFYFVNNLKGWFVAPSGNIYATTNSGAYWTKQTSPINGNFQKVFFINENTGWITAFNLGILRTTSGGLTGILSSNSEIPKLYSLSQNYPNPFNPATTIRFDIPFKAGTVKLAVYNSLGQQVASLVDEELSPGSYEYTFDGSTFASGVYFYSINTDGFSDTKKMLLAK